MNVAALTLGRGTVTFQSAANVVATPTQQVRTSTFQSVVNVGTAKLGHGSVTFQNADKLTMENIVGSSSTNNKDPLHNMNYKVTQMDDFNINIGVPQKNCHLSSRGLMEKDNNNMFSLQLLLY